jgi:hypothetical protein
MAGLRPVARGGPTSARIRHARTGAPLLLPQEGEDTMSVEKFGNPSVSACWASAPSAAAPSRCCRAISRRSPAAPDADRDHAHRRPRRREARARGRGGPRPGRGATRAVVTDPDIDIVIELIGGYGIAKDLVLEAIENGKHVVTANKALLAVHGNEIFAAPRARA